MGQTAALDVVGVIGEVDLRAIVDTPADLSLLLFTKSLQQGALLGLPFPGKRSIGRDIPCLSDKDSAFHLSRSAPITDGTLGDSILFGILTYG